MRAALIAAATLVAAAVGTGSAAAQPSHRDPCHSTRACPSDHHSYAWRGLTCTSFAGERRASDTQTVTHAGRRYWCRGKATSPSSGRCHPSYKGACLDPTASDYDCAGGSGNGPKYTGLVRVVGPDQFRLDTNGDGLGCE
jgi:hypothetical protein